MQMTSHPLLTVDVADLLANPGESQDLIVDASLEGLTVPMGKVVDDLVHVDVLLESLVEGILASGSLSGRYELSCARCIRDFVAPFSVEVSEMFTYPEAEEAEEGFVIEDGVIDLETMVHDETLLGIPPNPLHDPNCKGLCPECGQDLNEGLCGHSHESRDIRWEPLRALKETLPESPN